MGVTFGGVAAAVSGVLAAGLALLAPGVENELGFFVMAFTTWGFLIGAGFASVLAIAARGRTFEELSLPRVALWGATGGVVLAGVVVGTTLAEWTLADAMVPLVILPTLGAASATVSVVIARRGTRSLAPDDDPGLLPEGEVTPGRV